MNAMSRLVMLSITGLSLFSSMVVADDHLAQAKKGDVIPVQLHQLKPTQSSVGYDQVFYKLGRYEGDTEKKFDEICEANGQKAIKDYSSKSNVAVASSFECTDPVGTATKDMKTVVIGPDNGLYLTDGHHTFNVFWHMPDGGANFEVHVVVADDYRDLTSMDDFWSKMQAENNLWLYDDKFEPIDRSALPESLGLENFHNNLYRSLVYFSREIVWDKPKPAINFVEFYWGKEIYNKVDLSQYDLNSMKGYKKAVKDVSDAILAVKSDNVGGIGMSASRMGQYEGFDKKEFEKLFRANKKVDYMLRYKKQMTGAGLSFDKAINHSHSMQLKDSFTLSSNQDLMAVSAINVAGEVNALIEIPTGTSAKWEMNKNNTQEVIWELKDDKPRIVNYLGYPGNYGTIPGTAMPKELGGDGDPLDVLVLGQSIPRGEVLSVRLIGVLKMLDDGEQDDKLVAVITEDSPFANVESMQQLDEEFPAVSEIVRLWFENYKGPNGGMEAQGFADHQEAMNVLKQAMNAYQNSLN
ncbi:MULTISPECIES: ParB-like protein [unclassified Methylophaga]|uniref:ParB-like protein n=1 Tax=unclassified Methylophaga TaxID=2629249 RepID=UPI0025DE2B31|nr:MULTISPECIES: ParB-like protein [unclassified Methylophaga]